jgi:hypothetical protein
LMLSQAGAGTLCQRKNQGRIVADLYHGYRRKGGTARSGGTGGVLVHQLFRQVGQRAVGLLFLIQDGVQGVLIVGEAQDAG